MLNTRVFLYVFSINDDGSSEQKHKNWTCLNFYLTLLFNLFLRYSRLVELFAGVCFYSPGFNHTLARDLSEEEKNTLA
jgi:hypothetical protein